MPRDVSVVFVHGILAENARYADPMRNALKQALRPDLRRHLRSTTVFWGDIVRNRTNGYYSDALDATGISRTAWRRLVLEGLGDAAAYQKTRNRENSAYFEIQTELTNKLREADAPEDPDRPLVFIAHSLGCHIVSSYAWDVNRLKQVGEEELVDWDAPTRAFSAELKAGSPFRRLDTLAGMVTLGCNMPLFTFMFGPERVYPITHYPENRRRPAFPGTSLTGHLRQRARWINVYSPNDLLGWPLKPLNSVYRREERIADHEVHVEGRWRARWLPSAWNAMRAHTGYWTDRAVIALCAELVSDLMTADDAGPGSLLWT